MRMPLKSACFAVLAGLALIGPAFAQTIPGIRELNEIPGERTDAKKFTPYKIILVGDSTMAPQSGWASAFCAYHIKSSMACLNLARGGRSTRSYRAEGSWDIALDEMKVPGYRAIYVLIQMGHNDMSSKAERWTDEVHEFPDNLRRFVTEARAAGAIPVLVTPLTLRDFKNGRLYDVLASWSDQVRKVAHETSTPLIDLNADSAALVQKLGPVAAMEFAMSPSSPEEKAAAATGTTLLARPAEPYVEPVGQPVVPGPHGHANQSFDYTHLGPKGAEVFAAMVAYDMAVAVPEISGQILP